MRGIGAAPEKGDTLTTESVGGVAKVTAHTLLRSPRDGERHGPGVWLGSEPVHEMTVFSPSNEMMTISLLIYPERAPSRWEAAELEEVPTEDTFDKFIAGKTGG